MTLLATAVLPAQAEDPPSLDSLSAVVDEVQHLVERQENLSEQIATYEGDVSIREALLLEQEEIPVKMASLVKALDTELAAADAAVIAWAHRCQEAIECFDAMMTVDEYSLIRFSVYGMKALLEEQIMVDGLLKHSDRVLQTKP
ncbi:MAG: hypothetical protein ACK4SL_01020 [Candidatus Paceibacteria bacterium]